MPLDNLYHIYPAGVAFHLNTKLQVVVCSFNINTADCLYLNSLHGQYLLVTVVFLVVVAGISSRGQDLLPAQRLLLQELEFHFLFGEKARPRDQKVRALRCNLCMPDPHIRARIAAITRSDVLRSLFPTIFIHRAVSVCVCGCKTVFCQIIVLLVTWC